MINLRESHIEDLVMLAENAMEPGIDPRDVRLWAAKNIVNGPAYTGESDGKIVAAGGVWLVRPGVGMIWIVISKEIERTYSFLKELIIIMRNMVEILAETFGLKKIRTYSKIGFGQSQSLLHHLGFIRLRRTQKSHYIYLRRF